MMIFQNIKIKQLNIGLLALLMLNSVLYSPISNSQEVASPFQEFGITANNFMFYHKDLEAAVDFYGEVLGLKKVLDYGTAVMFQLADTSYITLVRGSDKKYKPGRTETGNCLTGDG